MGHAEALGRHATAAGLRAAEIVVVAVVVVVVEDTLQPKDKEPGDAEHKAAGAVPAERHTDTPGGTRGTLHDHHGVDRLFLGHRRGRHGATGRVGHTESSRQRWAVKRPAARGEGARSCTTWLSRALLQTSGSIDGSGGQRCSPVLVFDAIVGETDSTV